MTVVRSGVSGSNGGIRRHLPVHHPGHVVLMTFRHATHHGGVIVVRSWRAFRGYLHPTRVHLAVRVTAVLQRHGSRRLEHIGPDGQEHEEFLEDQHGGSSMSDVP